MFFLWIFVFAAYSNVYDMKFVYDDEFYIQKNKFLDSFQSVRDIFSTNSTAGAGFQDSFYRPLQFFLYLLVKQTFGGEPWGFHLLNVSLHALNACLVFLLAQLVGFSKKQALLVSLFWSAHPVHTEVIAYMSGTADPLHAFFSLAALLVYFQKKAYSFFVASLFFICALLSKEVAVVFPGLVFSILFIKSSQRWNIKSYFPAFGFLFIALMYVLLRATVLDFNGDFQFYKTQNVYTDNFWFRFYTFLATLPSYLRLLVWPENLHIDRYFPVFTSLWHREVLCGAAIVLFFMSVGAFSIYKKKSWAPLFVGSLLWFASAHALHSGVLLPMNSLFLEHWLYLPSVSFSWLIIWVFSQARYTKLSTGLLFVCIGYSATQTYKQNRMWESPITLFSRILQLNPGVTRVRHNLAMAYSDQGKEDLAMAEYQRILREDAQPYPQTYHNMGLIYLRQNNLAEGERYLLKAIERSPSFHPAYDYLIQIYQLKGETAKAEEYKQKRLKLKSP
jgi:protein O-mannosyl-transferase